MSSRAPPQARSENTCSHRRPTHPRAERGARANSPLNMRADFHRRDISRPRTSKFSDQHWFRPGAETVVTTREQAGFYVERGGRLANPVNRDQQCVCRRWFHDTRARRFRANLYGRCFRYVTACGRIARLRASRPALSSRTCPCFCSASIQARREGWISPGEGPILAGVGNKP